MAKLIAVANMKGGVGKTATVVGLAETLAAYSIELARKVGARPRSVLVVDLDAQASASFALAGDEQLLNIIRNGHTIDGFLDRYLIKRQDVELSSLVWRQISDVSHQGTKLQIALLASSPRLRTAERALIHALTKGGYSLERVENDFSLILSDQLRPLCDEFDYIIFDCPPGISMMTEIALRLADLTIVPTVPDFLSMLGLDAFAQTVWSRIGEQGAGTYPAPPPIRRQPHVLFTQRRPGSAHTRMVAELRRRVAHGRAEYGVFRTEIPDADGVPEALERVTTYPNYAQKWNAPLRSRLSSLVDEVHDMLLVPR